MMDDNELHVHTPLPAAVVEALQREYAPPAADAYWTGLESRIMARIADSGPARWWMVVGSWARGGLVAAAALVVAAVVGVLMAQARTQELRTAYESATRPPTDTLAVPSGALSERDGPDTRGATFRDVISQ